MQIQTTETLLRAYEDARSRKADPEAAQHLAAALSLHGRTGQPVPRSGFFDLAALYYRMNRLDDAESAARAGLARLGAESSLLNLLGVVLKAQGRMEEAIAALEAALDLTPDSTAVLGNLGNALLAVRHGARAVEIYRRALALQPDAPGVVRLLGVALRTAGDFDGALEQYERARRLAPLDEASWIDLAALLDDSGARVDAFQTVERGIALVGPTRGLIDARIKLLRRAGKYPEAKLYIQERIAESPDEAWLHVELARTYALDDRPTATVHYAAALRLEPDNAEYLTAAADNLDRTRGPEETRAAQAAYDLAVRRLALGGNLRRDARILRNVLIRSCDFAATERLGEFDELGRYFAATGQEAALHYMMGQVKTGSHRRNLVEYHRSWGRTALLMASKAPLRPSPPPAKRTKIRIGFMSSDLRAHPVAYFVAPLLLNYDRSRFEVFCYSWYTQAADPIEQRIAASVDCFRKHPAISDRDAAQMIQDDRLDMLFELGGSTDMNKIGVMAWKPAPRQASWLGYPHSAGIEAIDRILVDPYLKPPDPALLVEKPFELERSWVALDRPGFGPLPDIDPVTPQERTGQVTFGTMNNIYKYNPELFATWAAILAAVPGSRLLFVRPEGGMASFRRNVEAHFAGHGIAASRIAYMPVRGTHLAHYNSIDVALDTFPQTGGTTTCETLWMGVPVVTLVGEAFFERLSYSNLVNAGLGEHCAFDRESYIAKAVALAADTSGRAELRRTMRDRLRSHPLGQPKLFTQDFQDTALRWMEEPR
jgi:protein O-GlcNAc transferase